MTSYFSLVYLFLFLPSVILVYLVSPRKLRPYVLLLASVIFYYLVSGKLLIYIVLSSILTYIVSFLINKKVKFSFSIGIITLLLFIIVLKYSPFILTNINNLAILINNPINLKIPKFLIPLGLSFYTLQAISYLIDIKRKTYEPIKNPFKLLLYLSFFLTVVEGPIVRFNEVKDDYFSGHKITYLNFKKGLIRMGYGLIKKMVIADRLNLFISNVFLDYDKTSGSIILLAAIFYTIQLYAEFSGTMDLVIGTAEIFGIKLKENFRRPFFSCSIQEFWQRWHISLGTWFKDYVFYPINLSKPIKRLRKSSKKILGSKYSIVVTTGLSLFVVWALNGLWHGVGFNYLFFGLYHFVLIYLASLVEPITRNFKFNKHRGYKYFRMLRTSFLVVIGELFFRATTLTSGLKMFTKIFTDFDLKSLRLVTTLGVDVQDLMIVFITLLAILVISILEEKQIKIRERIFTKPLVVRWSLYYAIIFYIIIFGAYGFGYIPVDPIYANF